MEIKQYDIYIVNLDPTVGNEIRKIRPCIIISPDEMNNNIQTVIIAPLTTKSHEYPTRLKIRVQRKKGWIVLDQIRTIDKTRLIKRLGNADIDTVKKIKQTIREMLVD